MLTRTYVSTRELPGVALVNWAILNIFTIIQIISLNSPFSMHGCALHLGPYLEVDCMNQSETNFSRTAQSQRFWRHLQRLDLPIGQTLETFTKRKTLL